MSKRRLTKVQQRRIQQRRKENRLETRQNTVAEIDDQQLGPEIQGRVVAHFGTQVDVEVASQTKTRCFLRANLGAIATGDWVRWRADQQGGGVVTDCEPRNSLLCRPDSYGKLKPVAANVDQIIVTIAPKPEAFANLIDRYIVAAECHDISVCLLINKSDLIDASQAEQFDHLSSLYASLGYPVIKASSKFGDGMDTLIEQIEGRTSIFVGQSGVGKSSIIQSLLPHENITVGQLSEAKRVKGRHTTTHAELFHLQKGGECIDSPGIREFGLWHLEREDVIKGFVELRELASQCRFRDCRHQHEPGCALREAVQLQRVSSERFDSYQRIIASLDEVAIKPLH